MNIPSPGVLNYANYYHLVHLKFLHVRMQKLDLGIKDPILHVTTLNAPSSSLTIIVFNCHLRMAGHDCLFRMMRAHVLTLTTLIILLLFV